MSIKKFTNKINCNLLFYIWLLFSVLFVPFIPTLFLFLLLIAFYRKKYTYQIFILFTIIFFTNLNYTRSIDADWENYIDFYKSLNGYNLYAFLTESQLSVRITEPFFYAFAWVLSNITNSNLYLYVLLITAFIYGIYSFGINKIIQTLNLKNSNLMFSIFCAFFICINFSETSHLIRQYISGSILFVMVPYLFNKKYMHIFFLLLIGTLVHNSFLLPAIFLIVSYILINNMLFIKEGIKIFMLSIIIGLIFGVILKKYLIILNAENFDNDTPIFISMIIDSACFIFGVILYHYQKIDIIIKKFVSFYLTFILLYSSFLFISNDNQLIFQRFYLYLEWFRVLGFLYLSILIPTLGKMNSQTLIAFCICLCILTLRIYRTSWFYGIEMPELLLKNFLQLFLSF
jgi:hypothetical protein